MENRENYFDLLGLDPSTDDWPAIETAVQQKVRDWSKMARGINMGAKRDGARYLALVTGNDGIEATLKDPARRAEERKNAGEKIRGIRLQALNFLNERISTIKVGGATYTPEQLDRLVKEFAGKLTLPEILGQVAEHGLTPVKIAAPRRSRQGLDGAQASKLRDER